MPSDPNDTAVALEELDPQPVISIRAVIPVAQLGEVTGERLEALSSFLQQQGIQVSGPVFQRYHTFGDTETDMETGVPVVAPVAGDGQIVAGELPGGPTISTVHDGPHIELGTAYARLSAWLADQDREAAGPIWEVYHWIDFRRPVEPAGAVAASSGRTQLVQPIR